MKTIDEILKRAIILTCLSDRCAQEKNIIGGIAHSLSERRQQSQAISNWLTKMNYLDACTDEEKAVFSKEVEKTKDHTVLLLQINYECIEPMLWTIGLVGHLSHYNDFVFTDFHPVLNFGRNHSFEELTKSCKLVPQTDFEVKREAAMLVYWCCLEARNDVFKEKNLDVVIEEVFGRQHVEILRKMDMFDAQINNLLVNGKRIPELNDAELAKLIQIAEKRFYAFEWIASEDNWDSVDLVC